MSFTVHGTRNGEPVSVTWLDPPGEPPGLRLRGDLGVEMEVDLLVAGGVEIPATPTGPTFPAALDPDYVALLTIVATLDPPRVYRLDGEVGEVPGTEIPPGAVA